MPSFTWPVLLPVTTTDNVFPETSLAAPKLPCPIEAFDKEHFTRLFERLLPDHYLVPLREIGPGYELYEAAALVGARVSEAIEHFACKAFILSSVGGSKATGMVQIYRNAVHPEGLEVTVKAGTLVQSSRRGRLYATTKDVVFLPDEVGPFDVPVQAIAPGYDFNEPGAVFTAAGGILNGEIDSFHTLIQSPDYGDITLLVQQADPTTGGVDAGLDAHGRDRGIARADSESDDAYRARVRSLPDNISPNAVDRALQRALRKYTSSYSLIETWDPTYQSCWDAPRDFIAGSAYDPNTFVYDDPRPPVPFRNRWLDEDEMRGTFIVVVARLPAISSNAMVYDDDSTGIADLQNAIGARAVSAYDVPITLGLGGLQGGYDGFDLGAQTVYKTLYETLRSVKAAGTVAVLELQGE